MHILDLTPRALTGVQDGKGPYDGINNYTFCEEQIGKDHVIGINNYNFCEAKDGKCKIQKNCLLKKNHLIGVNNCNFYEA